MQTSEFSLPIPQADWGEFFSECYIGIEQKGGGGRPRGYFEVKMIGMTVGTS